MGEEWPGLLDWGWQDVLSEVGEVGGGGSAFGLGVAGGLVRGRGSWGGFWTRGGGTSCQRE